MILHRDNKLTETKFGELFGNYKQRFVVIARSYVREEMVAEDIVADCFAAFWEQRDSLPEKVNAPAYIMTMVRNRCLNYLQLKQIHMRIENEIQTNKMRVVEMNIRSLESSDFNDLFADEIEQAIMRKINKLPPLTKDIFMSSRFEELTYSEIAEKYNVSPRRIEYEISKALKYLRSSLKWYIAVIMSIISQN